MLYLFRISLYSKVAKIEKKVENTSDMITVINNCNKSNLLTSYCRLSRFDFIDVLPSIDNISGLKAVESAPSRACIIEVLALY